MIQSFYAHDFLIFQSFSTVPFYSAYLTLAGLQTSFNFKKE